MTIAEEVAQDRAPGLLEIVVTASRARQRAVDVARALTIVDEAHPVDDVIPDQLRGKTGIFVQETTPGQGTPIVRGLIGSSVLILVDGMRLNNAIFRPAPNQYMALIDPYSVERIEVVRGTGSALYGSDALGGVVNVLTKEPGFNGEDWESSGELAAAFDSTDLGRAGHANVAIGKAGVSASVGFTYLGHDDLRTGSGTVEPTAYDAFAGGGKVILEGESHELLLSANYLRQPSTPRIDELVPGFDQDEPSSAVAYFEPNDRLFLHARYRHFLEMPVVDMAEAHVAFQEINDDQRTRDFRSPDEVSSLNRSRYVGLTGQAQSSYSHWLSLNYGIDAYVDRVDSSATVRDINTNVVSQTESRFADGSEMTSVGLFLQGGIELTSNTRLSAGVRGSYFGLDIPPADRGVGTSRDLFDATGQLSLLVHATREIDLVGNVGRGVRAPNVFDLSTLGPRPGNRFNIPNPDLDVEQILGADIGVRLHWSGLEGSMFAFFSEISDRITAVDVGETTPDGRVVAQSQNVDSVTLAGLEADWNYPIHSRLNAYGNLTFTWAKQTTPDGGHEPADRIPPVNGVLGLKSYPMDRLELGLNIRWAGDQNRLSGRDRADPRINPNGTAGWVTLNGLASLHLRPNLEVSMALTNALDRSYREHGSGIDSPGVGVQIGTTARF